MRRRAIVPADRFGRLVVMPNIPTNLPGKVGDGCKDAARKQIAFNFGKPVPGRLPACGLPANWPIRFVSGFEDYQAWHQFSADGTLDIERRQP